jgi:SAM-dependent methyltransferase
VPGLRAVSRAEVAASLLPRCRRLLDYGCGDGSFLLHYALPLCEQAVGVDLAEPAIARARSLARERNAAGVEFRVISELGRLPFENSSFDCVTALAVLEHVFWPLDLLAELYRVLQPGGRLIVEVPNVGWAWHRLQLLRGRFPDTAPGEGHLPGVDDGHLRYFTVSSLVASVRRAGFRPLQVSCAGRGAGLRRRWVAVLGADIVLVAERPAG